MQADSEGSAEAQDVPRNNGRFVGIAEEQFVIPSFDQMGGGREETEEWVLQMLSQRPNLELPGQPSASVSGWR